MKLARPDVFHPRIVLAGWPGQVAGDGDDAGLVGALRRRGLHARWLSWDDPETERAHLVILRAPRDYAARLEEFLTWSTGVQSLLNAPAVVAWNANRRYLADLAARGVPAVPAEVYAPGRPLRLPSAGPLFVGPQIGTGTRRFSDRSAAAAHIADLQDAGHRVSVQTGSGSETVLVFLGGTPSHAFVAQEDVLRQGEADFELWDVGTAALAAAAIQAGVRVEELLYARVHLVGDRLLELQLVDPSLGWRRLDSRARDLAQREFALSVESALERLDLGPFSRRYGFGD
ncbi:hypothetical protein [Mycobacterium angelicum]|uniref:ATP-grasp domain-containing protein n=1 Tax=Mycobacterium angelicum TaxID=470074 RepID=A0A1W9ZQD8_MYCAN|nr:hypothetical protein [Mycobacterium angelicum]MCV7196669.1 hypothetical protein [Mycobacterium angelicum]ORA20011.1 hypothetical protein BST12_16165 [Mycobacterium angelicum]